jgi:dTDP-4-amino-4,6-dideoxygalactose transaminase
MLGVGPGDLVVGSSLTFIGSLSAARHLGADVALVDCDETTWNMDPALLAAALASLEADGRRPKAVIPTDIYGQCADYDRIVEVCRPYDIPVIIDSAEAMGAKYKGRHAGTAGMAAAFSFNGNKIITTSGGGALASEDGDFVAKARWYAQQARDPAPHYQHSVIGYNYRMSNIVAAIGLGQLEVLGDRVRRKHEIFETYVSELGELPGVSFMPEAPYGESTRWLTVALIDADEFGSNPETIRQSLETKNIESRPLWKPMHLQPVFEGSPRFGGDVSERLFERGLCLPSGTAMDDDDLRRVVASLRTFRAGC